MSGLADLRDYQRYVPSVIHHIGTSRSGRESSNYKKEKIMDNTIKPDTNTRFRFVAFLDIMGFKDLVARKEHEEVLKIMETFQPTIDVINRLAKQNKENMNLLSTAETVMFSDSIIIVSKDDSSEAARMIIFWAQWILSEGIKQGIPIKGSIAYGKQTAN